MQGIVLCIGMVFLVISYIRKSKKPAITLKNQICLICISMLLLITCICQVFIDSSRMYINYEIKDELLSEVKQQKTELQEENTQKENRSYRETSTENNYSISDKINKLGKVSDYLKKAVIAILILLCAYIFYKQSLIKKYCENLENDLYELQHTWINGKTLKNILIKVQIITANDSKEYDICDYFRKELKKNISQVYIILGNPGEGKTVSIRQVCEMILQDRKVIEENYRFWRRIKDLFRKRKQDGKDSGNSKEWYVPVMLDFSQIRNINTAEEFRNAVVKYIYQVADSKYILGKFQKIIQRTNKIIEAKMKQGKFIFLIDGYDEITAEERYKIVEIIEQYRKEYGKCSFILASRTAVYEKNMISFIHKDKMVHLLPFTKEKVFEFLSKWDFQKDRPYWELYEQIINNYQLERLAKNPLLLTLIAYLYETSSLEMPTSITEFYLQAIKCLLEQWENEKKIFPRIKVESWLKGMFLEETANWVFNNTYIFTKRDVMKATKKLLDYGTPQSNIFNEIYTYSGIWEKNGNLFTDKARSIEDGYKFYHRSFYEFFMAQYVVHNSSDMWEQLQSQQNYRIAFFYFALSENKKRVEEYLVLHMNELAMIEPLLIECAIEDHEIIETYVSKKEKQEYARNESYYQMLGNVAEKYKYTSPKIYSFLEQELQIYIFEKNANQIIYVIRGLSYFCAQQFISNLLLDYSEMIDWEKLTVDGNVQFNDSIFCLLQDKLPDEYKIKILDGLRKSGRYSFLYQLFQSVDNEKLHKYIMDELLQLTKNVMFIGWLDEQELIFGISDEKIRNEIMEYKKHYNWKWGELSDAQILNRYVLVYYLLNTSNSNVLDMSLISNRIKFVASYIKNADQKDEIKPYYIDIPEYRVESLVEFKFHWEKGKRIKRLLYDPVIARNMQWALGLLFFGVLMFKIIYFKSQDLLLKHDLYSIIASIRKQDELEYYRIASRIVDQKRSELKASRYLKPDSHMIIFYFSWIYLQIRTYKQYIDKPYSKIYYLLYSAIAIGYLVGYFFIFQDITFRIVGIVMSIVLYLIARFQHRYNMPSFRDPQFERIRKYLENDEL